MQKTKSSRLLGAKEPTRRFLLQDLIIRNNKRKTIKVSKFKCWGKLVLIKKGNLLLIILKRMELTIQG